MPAASAPVEQRHGADVSTWLACGAAFAAPGPVERIDTHAASIFLHGDCAWKIKRPVNLGYLDFSTPEKRKAALDAELRLNRRTAPDLYVAVHPIQDDGQGGLTLDGEGPARDWVLEMRRFPDDALLSHALARDAVDDGALGDLADALVDFHRRAAIADVPCGSTRLRTVIDGNARAMARFSQLLPPDRVAGVNRTLYASLDDHFQLLNVRRREGKVRHCHGDLHLANIAVIDGRLVPFDCLEFDDELATCDVLYDLAFLLMDLWEQGYAGAANLIYNRYLDLSAFDEAAVGLMPLFLAVRACVRAHVEAAQAREEGDAGDAAKRALRYLDFAECVMAAPDPRLVAIGGLSGTGKSTLARALGCHIGRAPGARILRSDVLRKRIAGVAPEVRLPPRSYTAGTAQTVYREIERLATQALAAGQCVIADATFRRDDERDRIAEVARQAGVAFHGLWLRLDDRERFARVEARPPEASDADLTVARSQTDAPVPLSDRWTCLDTVGTVASLRANGAAALGLSLRPQHSAISYACDRTSFPVE